jgi:hypothetical protein
MILASVTGRSVTEGKVGVPKKMKLFRSLNPNAFSPLERSLPLDPVQTARQRLNDVRLR